MIDLKGIKEKCNAATPGPWKVVKGKSFGVQSENKNIASCFRSQNEDFIATCNPTTVLALLDHIDKLTKAAKDLLEGIPIGEEDTMNSCICDVCPEHENWNCRECPPVKLAKLVGLVKEATTNETP